MNLNFEFILFYATLACGVIALADILYFAPKRKKKKSEKAQDQEKLPVIIDYARSFFPVLLIVFLLRSFLFEPFRIPSGSLKPTLLVGDFILVNKFDYGIRLPVIHKKIYALNEPKRGDIIVFRWPLDPSVDFIKRVIGVPGDRISYVKKVLTVNGQEMPQQFEKNDTDHDGKNETWNVIQKKENFFGIQHSIYQIPEKVNDDFHDLVVPSGMYFVMGDNRDDSADSRFWGFVPETNILGKASVIWMSWNSDGSFPDKIRWNRLGEVIR